MAFGVVWLEPDRLAVVGDGLVQLVVPNQGVAEAAVAIGVIGASRIAERDPAMALSS